MKLYYYKRPQGNFGDDLNPWLWPRILPDVLDEDDGAIFVGLGTLLNDRLPRAKRTVVLGAGVGYGSSLPAPDASWTIYGVRGHGSAAALGLDKGAALVDPGAAVRDVFTDRPPVRRGVGFMPHVGSLDHWDWRRSAEDLGLVFVDPEAPVETTMRTIAGLERLVTEAMHGAIVADALRTPWTAVAFDPLFLPFKWHDWGGSLDLAPNIHALPPLFDMGRGKPLSARVKNSVKRVAVSAGLGGGLTPPWPPRSSRRLVDGTLEKLRRIADAAEPQLSDPAALDRALDRLHGALGRFRADHAAGRYPAG